MTTKEKLKAIAAKYTTPFISDNLEVKVQYINISVIRSEFKRVLVLGPLDIDIDQNIQMTITVLNKIASDIGATGYLEAAPKVAAEIYDVMIGDGYTCMRGDKAAYVEHYVNAFKELSKFREKTVNATLLNYTSLSTKTNNVLIDPCGMSKYYTEQELKDLFEGTSARKDYLMNEKFDEIVATHYSSNTRNQDCGIGEDGQLIIPAAKYSQSIDVNTVFNVVNTVYTDAFNSEDFYKPSGPPPPPATTPPKGGFPVWAMLLIALGICLFVGGLIILSGDSNNN